MCVEDGCFSNSCVFFSRYVVCEINSVRLLLYYVAISSLYIERLNVEFKHYNQVRDKSSLKTQF